MKIGFLGTGKIASALVEGLVTCSLPPDRIIVSPRNRVRAESLAERFGIVDVASTNQVVVNESELIFIALRPETAEEVLGPLSFSENQTIVSLIPTKSMADIMKWTSPVEQISRATPLPSSAKQKGPILHFSPNPITRSVLERVGDLIEVPNETALHVLWAMTGMISPGFDLMAAYSDWAISNGVDQSLARIYTARFFHILAELAVDHGNNDVNDLSHEAATPGGLNEQASRQVQEEGGFDIFIRALDAVYERFE